MQWKFSRVVDACLILIVCVAPWFLGGRYAVGRLAFVSLAAVAAVAYAVHFVRRPDLRWRHSGALWLFVAAALLVACQLVPLPKGAIDFAHPTLEDHLPLWAGDTALPAAIARWDRVSLYPHATLVGLAMLGGYAAIFLVALQRLHTLESVERTIRWIAVAGVAMASIGIVQYVAGNGKFLWWYEHPFRSASLAATGAFDNNNHFAHFLALAAGPLVWWLVVSLHPRNSLAVPTERQRETPSFADRYRLLSTPYVPLLGLGILLFAGLLSTSRGGSLVILLAMATAAGVLYHAGKVRGKSAAALAVASLVVFAGLGVHGLQRVSRGLDDFTAGSVDALDSEGFRRAVWNANLDAISENLVLGTGVGTHRYAIPIYLDKHYPTEFSHAESGYLQVLTEMGVAGGILLLAALALCGWWAYRSLCHGVSTRHVAASAAIVSGLVASVVHSIWDFPWYIPATMSVTCVLAACLCRLSSLAEPRRSPAPSAAAAWTQLRWAGLTATVVGAVGVVFVLLGPALASPSWSSYLRRSVAWQAEQKSLHVESALSADEQHANDVLRIDAMIADLENAARHDPSNARVHLRLAGKLLTRYEYALRNAPNEMPISQLRDAAVASRFASSEDLHAWVERAVGAEAKSYLDRTLDHVHRAHEATPLEPDGYLHLADLAFLEGASPEIASAYLQQARHVDPHDGDVLVRAGAEAFLEQDFEMATNLWQAAYNTGPEHQRKMVLLLAGHVPVAFFLEQFEPDMGIVEQMEFRYSQLEMPQELTTLRRYAASRAVSEAQPLEKDSPHEAAELWLKAHRALLQVDELQTAAACGRRAVALHPNDFRTRWIVAGTLNKVGAHNEAADHLRWCMNRKPDDAKVRRELQRTMAHGMRAASEEAVRQ